MKHFNTFASRLRKLAGLNTLRVNAEPTLHPAAEPMWVTPAYLRRKTSGTVQRLY
ncbi:MAG: hypothetical protein RJA34_1287 [Pseudomonadota bacterium]|jgi:hypothetical protein